MMLSRRSLRAMRDRWERDLARLYEAYPVEDWQADSPAIETVRNLATAIAQIEGVISARRDSDGTAQAALNEDLAVPKDCQARADRHRTDGPC